MPAGAEGVLAGAQVTQSLPDIAFLNCRPSVIAAAIVYAERRSRGIIPFWPSMLSKLSGYQVHCIPRILETHRKRQLDGMAALSSVLHKPKIVL